jgi:uncharacterized protein YwlG (UPF0340 family)
MPGTGHIYFEQCVDAVLSPIQVEVIVSVAPCGRDLYDAVIELHLRHRNSSPIRSLVRAVATAKIQAPDVRVGFIPDWLQFEFDIESRNPKTDINHRIQVEF